MSVVKLRITYRWRRSKPPLENIGIEIRRRVMRPAGKFVIAGFPELPEAVDPLTMMSRMGIGGRS